ncbi:sulfatase-like hydrolase/transferase [Motilibacter aurantiacus]|uniref:sulfatase-like hydrolase/transferase n=1 Tax=Motilibacter aurantiacus TaxID=2714955 RepID=UPI0014082274|nr:sulfatase-like hydrolase/transferase [Motilibacter aurantiacus]NHC46453.1 sulfatase-like hydrolase/transferase [Motilibacter aurantiacus]
MTEHDLTRRAVLKGAAVTAGALTLGPALASGPASAAQPSAAAGSRPNFVLIMTDDQGYADLASYGAPYIDTPNLDGIAQRGIRCTDHYAGSPLCTPSRAALLTGAWPPRVNMPNVLNPAQAQGLSPAETTLPEYLRTAGYATAMFGKWHLGDPESNPVFHPMDHGFDRFFGTPYSNDYPTVPVYDDRTIVERIVYPGALGQDAGNGDEQNWLNKAVMQHAADWIRGQDADRPFLAYVAPTQPHEPVASEFQGSAGGPHGSSVEEIDMLVGEILQALDELGVRENTVVVFTSDNGPWWVGDTGGLKGRKGETYEGGQRVPFVMEWPAVMSGESLVYEGVTTHTDILPTFCAAAGVPLRDRALDGRNLLPLIEDGRKPPFFAELGALLDLHSASGQITVTAAAGLRDRLDRAETAVEQGRESTAVSYLEQLAARARNQVKGDADDVAARDAILSAVSAAVVTVSTYVDVAYYSSNTLHAIRYGDWKLHVRRVANPTRFTGLYNWNATDNMPELYNLRTDPEECYDLSEHEPEVLAAMTARLQAFDAALKADRALYYPALG